MRQTIRLFYVSAIQDEEHLNALKNHLKILQDRKLILGWHDEMSMAGDDKFVRSNAEFKGAEIILLLISCYYMASDECQQFEERALLRHHEGSAVIIPIIVRPVLWKAGPLQKLQALPPNEKPVVLWSDQDEAWFLIAEGIRRVADVLRG